MHLTKSSALETFGADLAAPRFDGARPPTAEELRQRWTPRLWSLFEMLQFYAASFTFALVDIENALGLLLTAERDWLQGKEWEHDWRKSVRRATRDVAEQCKNLPFPRSLRFALERLGEHFETSRFDKSDDFERGNTLLREARNNIIHEMDGFTFLYVDSAKQGFYVQPEPLFGGAVYDKYGDANRDIAAAGRCVALEEWTAAVFHLMRVVELGLYDMAVRLKLKSQGKPLDQLEMGRLIAKLEDKVREIRDTASGVKGKTQPKPYIVARNLKRADYYAAAGKQFWFFKEAWRNHVMHAHTTYDERQAMEVYRSVKAFMEHLAQPAPA